MTREQLDAIRQRVEAATPGPWLTDSCLDVYTEQVREIDPDIGMELYKTVYSHHTAGPEGTQPWHDTHFMAHAREDVPTLLAEVERLTELCAAQNATMIDALCAETDAKAKVERLTAEVEAKVTQNVALIRQNGRPQQEVERLTAERDALQVGDAVSTALGANERFAPSEHALVYIEKWCDGSGPCAVELEPHGHWRLSRSVSLSSVRKAERDAAFKRGVAAMREAAAQHFAAPAPFDYVAPLIRALPDPEDTE